MKEGRDGCGHPPLEGNRSPPVPTGLGRSGDSRYSKKRLAASPSRSRLRRRWRQDRIMYFKRSPFHPVVLTAPLLLLSLLSSFCGRAYSFVLRESVPCNRPLFRLPHRGERSTLSPLIPSSSPPTLLYAAAPRKRSKIKIGEAEMSFFFDEEEEDEIGEEEGWSQAAWQEGTEEDGAEGGREGGREGEGGRGRRLARSTAAEIMQAKIDDPYYQYRDRRMFKMGEDERAYYDSFVLTLSLFAYSSGSMRTSPRSPPPLPPPLPPPPSSTSPSSSVPSNLIVGSGTELYPGRSAGMSPAVLEAISSFLVEGGEEPLLLTEREEMGGSGGGGRFGVGQGGKEEAKEKERVRWLSDEAAEGNARGAVEEREEGERLFSSEWYAGEMRRRNDQGKYSLALTYWERLLREGIRPCPAAYTQALRACRFTGEMELALEL
ncbi:hypothetical protein Naga_101382g1 [Nannochloropsis gaditana]|uniref:Uncharacterized protein n=1 Tax=Nannochloropsis gaditana TaxID=72520 RepID=W7TV15_9STRA|nr:hypothetical protein Naga_101382g1 [Nannochloropsis gaditana]